MSLMVGILLLTSPPSAWGQLVPAADSHLPGQTFPAASPARVGTTSDRSRPLIAYHRDQQGPDTQLAGASRQSEATHAAKVADRAMADATPIAAPARIPTNFLRQTRPTDTGATREVLARSLPESGDPRRLLPAADSSSGRASGSRLGRRSSEKNRRTSGLVNSFPSMDVLRTAGTGLGIALGLLLLCAWLFRRNAPSPTAPLPKEVVNVLGRAQLASRQFVQLLKVGNKLVLVSMTPEGTEPITEVTDPVEVDRLLSLCMRNHSQSTTAEFQQVLSQLSREGAKGFLGK